MKCPLFLSPSLTEQFSLHVSYFHDALEESLLLDLRMEQRQRHLLLVHLAKVHLLLDAARRDQAVHAHVLHL